MTKLAPKRHICGIPPKIVRYKHGKEYRRIKNELVQQGLRNDLALDNKTLPAGIVMSAALEVSQDIDVLYRFLGYNIPKFRIAYYKQKLTKSGVWENDETHAEWMDEYGWMAFMLDCMVATGILERA